MRLNASRFQTDRAFDTLDLEIPEGLTVQERRIFIQDAIASGELELSEDFPQGRFQGVREGGFLESLDIEIPEGLTVQERREFIQEAIAFQATFRILSCGI